MRKSLSERTNWSIRHQEALGVLLHKYKTFDVYTCNLCSSHGSCSLCSWIMYLGHNCSDGANIFIDKNQELSCVGELRNDVISLRWETHNRSEIGLAWRKYRMRLIRKMMKAWKTTHADLQKE